MKNEWFFFWKALGRDPARECCCVWRRILFSVYTSVTKRCKSIEIVICLIIVWQLPDLLGCRIHSHIVEVGHYSLPNGSPGAFTIRCCRIFILLDGISEFLEFFLFWNIKWRVDSQDCVISLSGWGDKLCESKFKAFQFVWFVVWVKYAIQKYS